ncbi:MAG: helix-turn-helix domain-containing protein [Actinophytocola sp.]|uniref:IclR family transcriptional regulator n=1 Tax=Actinophytocola sp. TaxID=1872138 RepID=UPI003C7502E9
MQPVTDSSQPAGTTHEDMLGKAIRLVELLSHMDIPIGPSAVSRLTGIPKSTAFRLLRTLADHGMASYLPDGYIVGPRARRLGHHAAMAVVGNALTPFLVDLYDRTGDVVYLAVLDGYDAVTIRIVRSSAHWDIPPVPDRVAAMRSAAGRLLCAHRDFPTFTGKGPWPIPDSRQLEASFAALRRRGAASWVPDHAKGVIDFAVPVHGIYGPVAAVVRVRRGNMPFDKVSERIHREIARAASAAVRRRTGGNTELIRRRPRGTTVASHESWPWHSTGDEA